MASRGDEFERRRPSGGGDDLNGHEDRGLARRLRGPVTALQLGAPGVEGGLGNAGGVAEGTDGLVALVPASDECFARRLLCADSAARSP